MESLINLQENVLSNLTQQIPVKELKESIIFPFYYSHGRYENNKKWTNENYAHDLSQRLQTLVDTCNFYVKEERLSMQEDHYSETYKHLDFKKNNHPTSWNIYLNESDKTKLFFNRVRLVIYYDEKFDVLSGGIVLHCDHDIKDQKLFGLMKHSYLINFFNYFIEEIFTKKIVAQYPHLFSVITQLQEERNLDDVLSEIRNLWVGKVKRNFTYDLDYLLSNQFIDNHILLFFLLLNVLNILKPFNQVDSLNNRNLNGIFDYLKTNLQESEQKAEAQRKLFESKQKSNKQFLMKKYDFKVQPLNFSHPMYLYSTVLDDLNALNNTTDKDNIYLLLNMFLNPDSYLVGPKSKLHVNELEFLNLTNELLNNKSFINELDSQTNENCFYNNYHFKAFNYQNSTLLLYSNDTLKNEAEKSLINFYTIASIYFAAYRVSYLSLNNFTSYVMNSEYNRKSFTYRRIRYDLQLLNLNFFYNFYGVDSIKYIVKRFNDQLQLQAKVQDLMAVVRKIDEAEKLIVERNSIATAFISALFVGIIWFCDQCYASLQSTGSGNDAPSWNTTTHTWNMGASFEKPNGQYYPPWTIAMPIIYGFIGIAAFICFVVTIILIYQSIKLYLTYHNTKKEGIENVY